MPLEKTLAREMRIHIDAPFARSTFREYFYSVLTQVYRPASKVIVLCIGTDRSTGDSLGPLVGERLGAKIPHAQVLGNLAHPVHAVNLKGVLEDFDKHHQNPFIIAIDASLGSMENVGTIKLAPGALRPGAGVKKNLPAVGDFHITGTVNIGGFMEYMVLQNTRLFTVMKMVEIISDGIKGGLQRFFA